MLSRVSRSLTAQHAGKGALRAMSSQAPSSLRPKTTVLKFGGSSVGNAEALRGVAKVTRHHIVDDYNVCIVASACFGVTDLLVGALEAAKAGDAAKVALCEEVVLQHHKKMAQELLGEHPSVVEDVMTHVERIVKTDLRDRLDCILEGAGTQANDTDVVASLGERLSNYLLAESLTHADGIPAQYVDAQEVVLTDGVVGASTPLLDETAKNVDKTVLPLLEEGIVPCVTGFYGSALEGGQLTTFGRGGSDLTAALMGRCLHADEISLYKVEYDKNPEGLLGSWNPGWIGVVHDGKPEETIPHLSYEAAAELAHFGKKVLHPRTVEPAVGAAIPIKVRNTFEYDHPGTVIHGMDELRAHTSTRHAAHARGDASFLVEAITKTPLQKYEEETGGKVAVFWPTAPVDPEHATLVAAVGHGVMDDAQTVMTQGCQALRIAGIPFTVPVSVNGNTSNFSVIVPSSQARAAVRCLHESFELSGDALSSSSSSDSENEEVAGSQQVEAAVAAAEELVTERADA